MRTCNNCQYCVSDGSYEYPEYYCAAGVEEKDTVCYKETGELGCKIHGNKLRHMYNTLEEMRNAQYDDFTTLDALSMLGGDLIYREQLIMDITGIVSEVVKGLPYEETLYTALAKRQHEIIDLINKQKTIDAQQVIRCRNCKYEKKGNCMRYADERAEHSTRPSGFCWLAESKRFE